MQGVDQGLVREVGGGKRSCEEVRVVDEEKIRAFEERGVPVDAYGVGSSLIRGANDFTADVVMTGGQPSGKFGRRLRENPRLELVT